MHLHKTLSFILVLVILSAPLAASAQTTAFASIQAPDSSGFPTIEFFLDAHNAQGDFIRGLGASDVSVMENGVQLPVEEISELKPGVQFVVSINPGPSFAVRNSKAISRFDTIRGTLATWAKSRVGSNIDDLSLVINNGPEVSHVSDSRTWLERLEAAEIDARKAVPNLDGLFRAVTIVNDPTPRQGMERVILFITPPIESNMIEPLDNLIMQAKLQDVAVHILLVSSAGGFQTAGVKRLMDLAAQTGGSFFAYSGDEIIPDPELLLHEYRSIYQVSYHSAIVSGGEHQVAVNVETPDGTLASNAQNIKIDLQPPIPAFIAPPIEILRQSASEDDKEQPAAKSAKLTAYEPAQQVIQVVFDFPDGRKRSIVATSLSVDGVKIVENTSPPFDSFAWDLSGFETNGTHLLQVQVVDEFGISGTSVDIPVNIRIKGMALNRWAVLLDNTPILIGLGVIVSGSILLLVLLLGGRLRPKALRVSQTRRQKVDVVTQPVPGSEDFLGESHHSSWADRLQKQHRSAQPKALALLYRIGDTGGVVDSAPFAMISQELLIGTEANWAGLVLHDSSVEKRHARLVRETDGCFHLHDEGSISGTWINYTPVSKNGAGVEHGDIIHIGKVGFRFNLRAPVHVRQPVVTDPSAQHLVDIPGLYVKTGESSSEDNSSSELENNSDPDRD